MHRDDPAHTSVRPRRLARLLVLGPRAAAPGGTRLDNRSRRPADRARGGQGRTRHGSGRGCRARRDRRDRRRRGGRRALVRRRSGDAGRRRRQRGAHCLHLGVRARPRGVAVRRRRGRPARLVGRQRRHRRGGHGRPPRPRPVLRGPAGGRGGRRRGQAHHPERARLPRRGHRDLLARPAHDVHHHRAGRHLPPEAQEALATRAGASIVRMATSHSPFLSQPPAVADVIERAAEQEPA